MSEEAIKIFYSYSRKDLDLRNALEDHLSALREAKRIETWHDLELEAGTEWEPAILHKLDTADIILLLISSSFIASKYCYGTELKRAIARHNEGTARVIPVILRPCDWNHPDVPFSKLNVLPTHAKAITRWADRDEAFADVAQRIRETVDQLNAQKLAERKQLQQEQQLRAEAEERQRQELELQQALEQQRQEDGERKQFAQPVVKTEIGSQSPSTDQPKVDVNLESLETDSSERREATSTEPKILQPVSLPWGLLTMILFSYGMASYGSVSFLTSKPFWMWGLGLALTLALALALIPDKSKVVVESEDEPKFEPGVTSETEPETEAELGTQSQTELKAELKFRDKLSSATLFGAAIGAVSGAGEGGVTVILTWIKSPGKAEPITEASTLNWIDVSPLSIILFVMIAGNLGFLGSLIYKDWRLFVREASPIMLGSLVGAGVGIGVGAGIGIEAWIGPLIGAVIIGVGTAVARFGFKNVVSGFGLLVIMVVFLSLCMVFPGTGTVILLSGLVWIWSGLVWIWSGLVWIWSGLVWFIVGGWTGFLIRIVAGVIFGILFGALCVFLFAARKELLKSFSRIHTSIILVANSSLGLVCGWLVGVMLKHL